jgi:hypothetical protein
LNKINYELVDSRVLIDSLSATMNSEVASMGKAVKAIDEDVKTKVKVAQAQQAEKISQLFQFDQVSKSNIEQLSHDLSHLEKTTERCVGKPSLSLTTLNLSPCIVPYLSRPLTCRLASYLISHDP